MYTRMYFCKNVHKKIYCQYVFITLYKIPNTYKIYIYMILYSINKI